MSLSKLGTVLTLSILLLPACGKKKEEAPAPTVDSVEAPQNPTPPDQEPNPNPPDAPPTNPPTNPPGKPPVNPPGKPPVKPPVTPPGKPPVKPPVTPPTKPPVTPPTKPPVTPPTPPPDQIGSPSEALYKAIPWGAAPERRKWSDTVRAVVRKRFSDFDQARDKDQFCPGYATASREQKENCFIAIIAAIAKFECDYRPALAFREPNGKFSVGLLMLSEGECSNARSIAALKNPHQNLLCGAHKMATLIARDNYLNGPPSGRGAASYWSTLRTPYTHPTKGYKLGKKYLIAAITKNYRGSAAKKALYESPIYESDFPQMSEERYERLLQQDWMKGFYNREDFERVLEME